MFIEVNKTLQLITMPQNSATDNHATHTSMLQFRWQVPLTPSENLKIYFDFSEDFKTYFDF
jgi:hypothetical protein